MTAGDSPADATRADEALTPATERRKGLLGHDCASQARRQVGRQAARAAGAHLRREWLDAPYWERLAKARGIRLPQLHAPVTPARMRRWLRRLGIDVASYKAWSAERSLKDFAANNPSTGLRPWVGFLLEALEHGHLVAAEEAVAEAG